MQPTQQHDKTKRQIPWWLHLTLAIITYVLLKYGLPELGSGQTEKEKLAQIGSQAAPILTIVFLFLSANALYRNVPEKTDHEEEAEDDLTPQKGQDETDK